MGIMTWLFGPTKRQRDMAAALEAEKRERMERDRQREKARKQLVDERWQAERRQAAAQNRATSDAPYSPMSLPASDPLHSSLGTNWQPDPMSSAVSGHGGSFDGGGASGDYGRSSSSDSSSSYSSSDSGSSSSDSGSSSSSSD